MKVSARRRGEDIIDFGMGNPDGATPKHIVDKLIEAALKPVDASLLGLAKACRACARPSATGTRPATTSISTPTTEAIVTIGSKEGIAHLCLAILDSQ